jgi:hypothetical protein
VSARRSIEENIRLANSAIDETRRLVSGLESGLVARDLGSVRRIVDEADVGIRTKLAGLTSGFVRGLPETVRELYRRSGRTSADLVREAAETGRLFGRFIPARSRMLARGIVEERRLWGFFRTRLPQLAAAGLDGLVSYMEELAGFFDEVAGRLEELGRTEAAESLRVSARIMRMRAADKRLYMRAVRPAGELSYTLPSNLAEAARADRELASALESLAATLRFADISSGVDTGSDVVDRLYDLAAELRAAAGEKAPPGLYRYSYGLKWVESVEKLLHPITVHRHYYGALIQVFTTEELEAVRKDGAKEFLKDRVAEFLGRASGTGRKYPEDTPWWWRLIESHMKKFDYVDDGEGQRFFGPDTDVYREAVARGLVGRYRWVIEDRDGRELEGGEGGADEL